MLGLDGGGLFNTNDFLSRDGDGSNRKALTTQNIQQMTDYIEIFRRSATPADAWFILLHQDLVSIQETTKYDNIGFTGLSQLVLDTSRKEKEPDGFVH